MFKLFFLMTSLTLSPLSQALDTSKEEMALLSNAMNDTRESIARALSSDAMLEKSFQKYAQLANAIISRTDIDQSRKHLAISELNLKQKPQLQALLMRAKVNKVVITSKLAGVFKKLKEKNKKDYTWSLDEGMGIHWRSSQSQAAGPVPASPITHILAAPFADRNTSEVGEERRVDLAEGRYQAFSTGIIFMNTQVENGIGHFFAPLETHNRIKVSASVFNADVSLFAMGFVGVSSAGAKTILRIKKSGRTICETEYDHGSVLAVAAWISDDDHGDQFSIDCTVRSTDNVNELNTTFTSKVSTMTAGGGASSASIQTKVREIQLKYFNN